MHTKTTPSSAPAKSYGQETVFNFIAARRHTRLQRLAPNLRRHVAALTCCAPEAEDLIDSFPGLLIALVSQIGTTGQRNKAFELVLEGCPLHEASDALGLPAWLRKMPAEAFREPIQHLPTTAEFQTKITNFIPDRAASTSDWLEHVSFADEACDSSFALWVAKHCRSIAPSRRKLTFCRMAAWAWHARQPHTTGYRIINVPWSPKMGLRRAVEELVRWRRRADLACLIGAGIERPWLESGRISGYDFVPLITIDDFVAESETMQNCLDQYADRLSTGLIRIYSIRKAGRRIADIEVGPAPTHGTPPTIVQIKGRQNRQASVAVWRASEQWLHSQALSAISRHPGTLHHEQDGHAQFWQPYLDWLPPARRDAALASNQGPHLQVNPRHDLPHPVLEAQNRRWRTHNAAA